MGPPLNDPNWLRLGLTETRTWHGPLRVAGVLLYTEGGVLAGWQAMGYDLPALSSVTLTPGCWDVPLPWPWAWPLAAPSPRPGRVLP